MIGQSIDPVVDLIPHSVRSIPSDRIHSSVLGLPKKNGNGLMFISDHVRTADYLPVLGIRWNQPDELNMIHQLLFHFLVPLFPFFPVALPHKHFRSLWMDFSLKRSGRPLMGTIQNILYKFCRDEFRPLSTN